MQYLRIFCRISSTQDAMKEKTSVKSAPKIVFWISFFCLVFVGVTFTSDAFGYRLPVLVSDILIHSQPVPGNDTTAKIVSNVLTVSKNNTTEKKQIKTHVAFLKVHKAGSTTMQNLFFRFGLRHKLNILLPKSGNYLLRNSKKMPLKPGQHYDIFACHTVYSKKWFDSLLPSDSVNIGIVREPLSRMISSAYYYRDIWGLGYLKKVPPANFIHNIVNFPQKYDTAFYSRTRNSMGKDFGFPSGIQPQNTDKIRQYLNALNSEFLLVLVMEKFDESLVLMKRVLNWSFIDILYLKTNSHDHRPVVLNETEKAKFRKTSFLDFEIYDFFSDIFKKKIRQSGNSFPDEVTFFKTVLDQVSGFCSKNNKATDATLVIQSSKWDSEFKVSNLDCQWMQTKEIAFITKLRKT